MFEVAEVGHDCGGFHATLMEMGTFGNLVFCEPGKESVVVDTADSVFPVGCAVSSDAAGVALTAPGFA